MLIGCTKTCNKTDDIGRNSTVECNDYEEARQLDYCVDNLNQFDDRAKKWLKQKFFYGLWKRSLDSIFLGPTKC